MLWLRRKMRFVAPWGIAFALFSACGGGGEGDDGGDATPPENGGETVPPEDDGEAGASLDLEAQDIAFSQETVEVPAGEQVTIEFTNNDSVPHNFAAYRSEDAAEEIFVGEIINGPNETTTYEFAAPDEPGTYFFRCDVHPQQMTGDLVVT